MPTRRKIYTVDYSKLHIKRKPYDRLMYMLDAGSRRTSYIIVHMRATSFINRLNSQRFIHSKVFWRCGKIGWLILGSLFIVTVRRINFLYVGDYAYFGSWLFHIFQWECQVQKNTKSTIQGVRENAISFLIGDQYYSLVTFMHAIPEKRNIIS